MTDPKELAEKKKAQIHLDINTIMFDKLRMSVDGKAIEGNPASWAIAEYVHSLLIAAREEGRKKQRELTLHQIREANLERDRQVFKEIGVWSLADWAVAWAGEVGEVLNKIKKLCKAHGGHVKWKEGDVTVKDVADELADALVYMDILAHNLGIDLEEAYVRKFNEVSSAVGATVKLYPCVAILKEEPK